MLRILQRKETREFTYPIIEFFGIRNSKINNFSCQVRNSHAGNLYAFRIVSLANLPKRWTF
jgi:hypothetical protein